MALSGTEATNDRRTRAERFWKERRRNMQKSAFREVVEEHLDRERTLAEDSCLENAETLFTIAVMALLAADDALASEALAAAEFYLETAIDSDDLGTFGSLGLAELGRAERLKYLVLVRWLRHGEFCAEDLRRACAMKASRNQRLFSLSNWRELDCDFSEWLAEQIAAEDPGGARETANKYYWSRVLPRESQGEQLPPEEVLALVAESLLTPGDTMLRRRAQGSLDSFYRSFTDWGPGFPENAVLYDKKLLYAYVRGRFFKGVNEPLELIRMMRLGE